MPRPKSIEKYVENKNTTLAHIDVSETTNFKRFVQNYNKNSQTVQITIDKYENKNNSDKLFSSTFKTNDIPNTHKKVKSVRKPRTCFTDKQKYILTEIFWAKSKLLPKELLALADALTITKKQVRDWFQNTRNRIKRDGIVAQNPGDNGKKLLESIMNKSFKMLDVTNLVYFFYKYRVIIQVKRLIQGKNAPYQN